MKNKRFPFHFLFFFALFPLSIAQEISPRAVVLQWTKIYVVNYCRAADLTTLEFRKGKSKDGWARKTGALSPFLVGFTDCQRTWLVEPPIKPLFQPF